MPKIADNLTQVRRLIQQSASEAGRNPSDITLLAVSKTKPASAIREAFEAGQRDFGENYAQEAVASAETLMVPYDLQARRPRRLLPEEREFLAEWQLEQVTPERSRA